MDVERNRPALNPVAPGLARRRWLPPGAAARIDQLWAIALKTIRDPAGLTGLIIVLPLLFVSLFPEVIGARDPLAINPSIRMQPPSTTYLFGTDDFGRDLFSRVVYGMRVSIFSSLGVVLGAALVGVSLGLAAGSASNWIDGLIMRTSDLFIAFPSLILAMAIVAVLGPSLQNSMLALVVIWWPQYARLARAQAITIAHMPYVEAARCVGTSRVGIMLRHILPNSFSPILVKLTLDIGAAILLTAGLSFLGLGVKPPEPELGALVTEGRQFLLVDWWYSTIPGLFIFLAVLGFNLVGDSLRDALDPTLR
jgi:peptide/nickel transport system permease protein